MPETRVPDTVLPAQLVSWEPGMDPQGKPLEGTFGQQSFDLMEDEFQTGIGSEIEMKPGWQELQQSRDVWLANQPVEVWSKVW